MSQMQDLCADEIFTELSNMSDDELDDKEVSSVDSDDFM
jgi:hypothetical protein